MNEYVSHGTNGLLHVPGRHARLDFSNARAIGARARESVERGHQRWRTSIPDILEFITTPTARLTRTFIPVHNRFAPDVRVLVSVVTIRRDAASGPEATPGGVQPRTGCEVEYLVQSNGATVDAMNAAIDRARGDFVLFINPGDAFAGEDSLRRMFAKLPDSIAVVHGHHILRHPDGTEELRHSADFATTCARLRDGDLWFDWPRGLPVPPATAIRRELLTRLRLDPRHGDAAILDLLFRAHACGETFFNCDEVVAIQSNPPPWAEVSRQYGGAAAVDRLLAEHDAVPASTLLARLGRLALHIVTVLDRHTPALARAVERMARGALARFVVRRLVIRTPVTPADPDRL